MHPRVAQLPQPDPDYHHFTTVLARQKPARVPLIELAVHASVVNELLGVAPVTGSDPRAVARATIERAVRLHHRLGYDVVKVSAPIPWNFGRLRAADGNAVDGQREWVDEHRGPIQSLADAESYAWPAADALDFAPLEWARAVLPAGMAVIGFSGGVLEFAMDLLGMQNFMLATRRSPDLVAFVLRKVGEVVEGVFRTYAQMEHVCALWLGDDLGHKHGLLVSPKLLREHVIPWYGRFAAIAHAGGKPFILHSCGQNADVLPDIVAAGVDAKHSFEDGILPVEQFYDRWHGQVGVLGGVDVHQLATGDEAAIRKRTRTILEHCAPGGGYAAGSGNSIPNYVPALHYLAMVEEVHAYNGRV